MSFWSGFLATVTPGAIVLSAFGLMFLAYIWYAKYRSVYGGTNED